MNTDQACEQGHPALFPVIDLSPPLTKIRPGSWECLYGHPAIAPLTGVVIPSDRSDAEDI